MKLKSILPAIALFCLICGSSILTGCTDTSEITVKNLSGVSVTMTVDGNSTVIPADSTAIFEVEGTVHDWSAESALFKTSDTLNVDGSAEVHLSSAGTLVLVEE